MGNHEWCEDCQTSDFHSGYPCNPKRLAKAQAERAERDSRLKRQIAKATILVNDLKRKGIKAELDEYHNVKVSIWNL